VKSASYERRLLVIDADLEKRPLRFLVAPLRTGISLDALEPEIGSRSCVKTSRAEVKVRTETLI
jgi:hypothetical protein